jgi:hypothetical protein
MKYIKTYESFLNENHTVRTDKVIKELNRILDLNKQRGADAMDIFEIPNDWTVYDKVVKASRKDMMEPGQCFQNALDFSKEKGLPCILGGFINKEELVSQIEWMDSGDENKFRGGFVFYPHAFNLDERGQVYDITIYNDPRKWLYVGIEVDPSKFTKGFTELLPYLNKLIGRKL